MKFQPKSEKEIAEANLWPNGEYPFEILEADEAEDKNGNGMFKLKVKVFKENGASQNIFDYVSGAWMEFKLRHLAEAANLLVEYEQGEIEAYQLVGKTGTCKINVSKDKTGQYPDKNGIADYMVPGQAKAEKSKANDDDEVPF